MYLFSYICTKALIKCELSNDVNALATFSWASGKDAKTFNNILISLFQRNY